MKFKKSIYKAEKLLGSYQHDPDITLLNPFKKASNDIGSKGYLLIKIRGQPRTSNHKPLKHQPRRTRTILRILRKRTNRLPRMASR